MKYVDQMINVNVINTFPVWSKLVNIKLHVTDLEHYGKKPHALLPGQQFFLSDSSLLSPFYVDEREMKKCNFFIIISAGINA